MQQVNRAQIPGPTNGATMTTYGPPVAGSSSPSTSSSLATSAKATRTKHRQVGSSGIPTPSSSVNTNENQNVTPAPSRIARPPPHPSSVSSFDHGVTSSALSARKIPKPKSTSSTPLRSSSLQQSEIASVLLAFPPPPTSLPLPPSASAGASATTAIRGPANPSTGPSSLPRVAAGTHSSKTSTSKLATTRLRPMQSLPRLDTVCANGPSGTRLSFTPTNGVERRISTSSLLDIRPISNQFSPLRPPTSPLPPLPNELPLLPETSPIGFTTLRNSQRISKGSAPAFLPFSSVLPLPPSIEPPTPKALNETKEVSFDHLIENLTPRKRSASINRPSSWRLSSNVSTKSSRSGSYASTASSSLPRPFATSNPPTFSAAGMVAAPSEDSESSEDSEIDINADLGVSAWRAGIMSRALQEIDSEDEETQAESVREITHRLYMEKQKLGGRTESPQQRRMAHKPYKIERKTRSQPSDDETDIYALSEDEEHFDLSFDHGSSPSYHQDSHLISPQPRRITSPSFSATSYGGRTLRYSSSRETLDGVAERLEAWRTVISPLKHSTSIKLRASLSHQALASVSEHAFNVECENRDQESAASHSEEILESPESTAASPSSPSRRPFVEESTFRPPLLRTHASMSSLKPLTTVSRLQYETRSATGPRLGRQTSNPALSLRTDHQIISPALSSACTNETNSRSASPLTPISPFPLVSPSMPMSPSAPSPGTAVLPRGLSLRPLRTSRSSSVLYSSTHEVSGSIRRTSSTLFGLESATMASSGASPPGMTSPSTSPNHGRRFSRSLPYVTNQHGGSMGKLILPNLIDAATS